MKPRYRLIINVTARRTPTRQAKSQQTINFVVKSAVVGAMHIAASAEEHTSSLAIKMPLSCLARVQHNVIPTTMNRVACKNKAFCCAFSLKNYAVVQNAQHQIANPCRKQVAKQCCKAHNNICGSCWWHQLQVAAQQQGFHRNTGCNFYWQFQCWTTFRLGAKQ